jgi:uncharacterized protein YjiS (DUF1127 family)
MSAPIAKTQFAFELPKLSYVDIVVDEPMVGQAAGSGTHGSGGWLAGLVAAFHAWRERQEAVAELSMMTDRELADIGLNRADIGRVFAPGFTEEFEARTAA